MSVNVVKEDLTLEQVAGNVPMDRVTQIQQLAVQAAQYAKLAEESARAARELAESKGVPDGIASLDENGKVPKEQLPDDIGTVTGVKGENELKFRTGNINLTADNVGAVQKLQLFSTFYQQGWHKVAKIPPIWQGVLRITKNYNNTVDENFSLQINKNIDTCAFTQLGSSGRGRDVDKIRIIKIESDYFLEIYYNAEVSNYIRISIFDSNPSRRDDSVTIINDELDTENPQVIAEYATIFNGGMIADRAIADSAGNNIVETYAPKSYFNSRTVNAYYTVYTDAEIDNVTNIMYSKTPDKGIFEAIINTKASDNSLGGGQFYITGYRASELYGYQESKSYNTNGIKHKVRSLVNGTWNAWVDA